MRPNIVYLAAIVLLVAVAVQGQRRVCEPGSVFKVVCNTCRCNLDGTDMACTRKQCTPDYFEFQFPGAGSRKICEPGSYFKMECNNCRCNEYGTNAACTLKACPPGSF